LESDSILPESREKEIAEPGDTLEDSSAALVLALLIVEVWDKELAIWVGVIDEDFSNEAFGDPVAGIDATVRTEVELSATVPIVDVQEAPT
jgi:hypothetical protein